MKYPLLNDAFSPSDLNEGIRVIKSGKLTMSNKTLNFEKYFSKKIISKYSIMTNSGSSANLLSVAAACNPVRKNHLKPKDEVLIPAVCWSTSLWPLLQYNLKPVFVDVDLHNLNMNINDMKKKITKKTKAIMCVHILGLSTNMDEISKIKKKNNLVLFEDTCESLGSRFKNKNLGTFGDFGTFSFYYSHQITSGEGGMIVCKTSEDYNLIKCLRSHGWSRNTTFHNKMKKKFKKIDERFLFVNSGYNLRPLDVTAAIAYNQMKRLPQFISIRNYNRNILIKKIKTNVKWNDQFEFINPPKNFSPSWFGLPILINNKLKHKKKKFLNFLNKVGIENRPIVSGNFLNQPAIKLYNIKTKGIFVNSQNIEDRGFFIGLHTKKINKKISDYVTKNLLEIDKI